MLFINKRVCTNDTEVLKSHFHMGHGSDQDETRIVRPSIYGDASNIARVEALVLSYRPITNKEIVVELSLSYQTTQSILH